MTNEEKELPEFRDIYDEHISTKNLVRELMNIDKTTAMNVPSIMCASLDMQKVLSTPRSQISKMYYSRKLSTYNFTIFDMVSKEGICNVWNETTGNRVANEISSCLCKFIIEKIQIGVK